MYVRMYSYVHRGMYDVCMHVGTCMYIVLMYLSTYLSYFMISIIDYRSSVSKHANFGVCFAKIHSILELKLQNPKSKFWSLTQSTCAQTPKFEFWILVFKFWSLCKVKV